MVKNQNKWFNDITPPDGGLSESVGYLDRLISGRGQKELLLPKTQVCRGNSSRGSNQQHKRGDHSKLQNNTKTTAPIIQIDDAKWLEERRKKFPKNDASNFSHTTVLENNPIEIKKELNITRTSKTVPNSSNEPSRNRKKTLFEKLMDSD